jgi:hypothetical protein
MRQTKEWEIPGSLTERGWREVPDHEQGKVAGTKMFRVDRETTSFEVDQRMGLAEWAEESVRGAVNQGGRGGGGGGQGCGRITIADRALRVAWERHARKSNMAGI